MAAVTMETVKIQKTSKCNSAHASDHFCKVSFSLQHFYFFLKFLTFLHCFHGIYRYFGNSNAKFHIFQCCSSLLWSFMKFGAFWYFWNFSYSFHGNLVVPMSAKIIQHLYIVGTYIVSKFCCSHGNGGHFEYSKVKPPLQFFPSIIIYTIIYHLMSLE